MSDLRIVCWIESVEDQDWWVAQCLEVDIAVQAKTLPLLMDEFARVIDCRFAIAKKLGLGAFEGVPPAPEEFFEIWNAP